MNTRDNMLQEIERCIDQMGTDDVFEFLYLVITVSSPYWHQPKHEPSPVCGDSHHREETQSGT